MSKLLTLDECIGKTIFDYNIDGEDLHLVFTDKTYIKIRATDITPGFGYTKLSIQVCDWPEEDKTDPVLMDLGVITEGEHKEAVRASREEDERREAEWERKYQAEQTQRELDEFERLRKKFQP
jgi:hypothetical protein